MKSILLCGLSLLLTAAVAQAQNAKTPNIVVILADDMDSINVSQREKPSLLTRIGMFWRK